MHSAPSRRRFLRNVALAAVAAPLGVRMVAQSAFAQQELPLLDPDNAQAKALAYNEDAASVQHPSFKPGSDCGNCQFYQGAPGSTAAACALFPGYNVKSAAWCSAWAKKA